MNATTLTAKLAIPAITPKGALRTATRKIWILLIVALPALALISAKYSSSFAAPTAMTLIEMSNHNPQVSVVHPSRSGSAVEVQLPAEAQPYQTTSLHSRIRGYLQRWLVDRGDHVRAGQVLALIDAPEFDQQLLQAEADLQQGAAQHEQEKTKRDQAKANVDFSNAQIDKTQATLKLAKLTSRRFKELVAGDAATQQQYDETLTAVETTQATLAADKADALSKQAAVATSESAIHTAEARVNSLRASLRRLKETEAFKAIVAPFDGTITKRHVDVGALIPDDGSKPLFTIIQDSTLRIHVDVPQTYAQQIHAGNSARVLISELPNREFTAKITRSSRAIDSASRTLAVELELANSGGEVISGSFVQVKFQLSADSQPLTIPTSTLKLTRRGPLVAMVGADHRIRFNSVSLGRDHGATIEVTSGLSGGETLVVNPAESLTEGTEVETLGPKALVAVK